MLIPSVNNFDSSPHGYSKSNPIILITINKHHGIMKGKNTFLLLVILAAVLMLVAGCTSTPAPSNPTPATTTTTTTSPTTSGNVTTINLVAQNIAFDTKEITVPACADVVINFDNKDSGIPHNFALYTNSQATTALFTGEVITGVKTTQYKFKAPCTPGDFYFRCDIHPTLMYGTFKVV
jgi:plastocyanin